MKISFDDKSYLDVRKSDKPGHIYITVSAKDSDNELKTITNSVEITVDQFSEILKSLNISS